MREILREYSREVERNMGHFQRLLVYLKDKVKEGDYENDYGKCLVYGIPILGLAFGQFVIVPIGMLEPTLETPARILYQSVRKHPLATI